MSLKNLCIKCVIDNEIKVERVPKDIIEYYKLIKENDIEQASYNGHLEVVKYLHEVIKAPCTEWAMELASEYGHIEVVKAECTKWSMDYASKNGHLEVVEYLHEEVKAP